jgi:hypothetical protein
MDDDAEHAHPVAQFVPDELADDFGRHVVGGDIAPTAPF